MVLAVLICLWVLLVPHIARALQGNGGGATDGFVVEPPPVVVKNAQVKADIAWCESKNDPLAKNPRSTAKGIYQFLDGTWKYYGQKKWGDGWVYRDVLNEADNRELGEWVIDTYGTRDWNASKYCWG